MRLRNIFFGNARCLLKRAEVLIVAGCAYCVAYYRGSYALCDFTEKRIGCIYGAFLTTPRFLLLIVNAIRNECPHKCEVKRRAEH